MSTASAPKEGRAGLLEGRVALVTGAAAGIGLAISRRLAREGAAVVLADLDASALESAVTSIHDELAGQALGVTADVRSPADTDAIVAAAEEGFGGLDIVVNNAGLVRGGAVHEMSDEDWDIVLDVILRGSFNVVRSAARLLLRAPGETIAHNRKVITISSVAGVYGGSTVNYSAAKAGQLGLTKGLAREWAAQHINVNAIAPGRIVGTRIGQPARTEEGSAPPSFPIPEPEIPIGRKGRPEDVAALVAFLASADSDYLTGEVIELHGGLEVMPRPPQTPTT